MYVCVHTVHTYICNRCPDSIYEQKKFISVSFYKNGFTILMFNILTGVHCLYFCLQ